MQTARFFPWPSPPLSLVRRPSPPMPLEVLDSIPCPQAVFAVWRSVDHGRAWRVSGFFLDAHMHRPSTILGALADRFHTLLSLSNHQPAPSPTPKTPSPYLTFPSLSPTERSHFADASPPPTSRPPPSPGSTSRPLSTGPPGRRLKMEWGDLPNRLFYEKEMVLGRFPGNGPSCVRMGMREEHQTADSCC